jgi:hypothetical protein
MNITRHTAVYFLLMHVLTTLQHLTISGDTTGPRELPDFVLTPADDGAPTSAADIPINGQHSEPVSVTVLKNIVRVTDDQPTEVDHPPQDVARFDDAQDVSGQNDEFLAVISNEQIQKSVEAFL